MFRLLLVIVLLISTGAVMVHGMLFYRQAATASMIAEEESTEQKSLLKETKELSSEKIGFTILYGRQVLDEASYRTIIQKMLRYSKGFYNTPYNPPDRIC